MHNPYAPTENFQLKNSRGRINSFWLWQSNKWDRIHLRHLQTKF